MTESLVKEITVQMDTNMGKDIRMLSLGGWYRSILKRKIMYTNEAGTWKWRECRVETMFPQFDWLKIWSNLRAKILMPKVSSFLWKMVHDLLNVPSRLERCKLAQSDRCRLCNAAVEDRTHSLILCEKNHGLSTRLQSLLPSVSTLDMVCLNLSDLGQVWVWGNLAQCLWIYREKGQEPIKEEIVSDMLERVKNLKETKVKAKVWKEIADLVCALCEEDMAGVQRLRGLWEEEQERAHPPPHSPPRLPAPAVQKLAPLQNSSPPE